jgi:hypothetical protein
MGVKFMNSIKRIRGRDQCGFFRILGPNQRRGIYCITEQFLGFQEECYSIE